MKKKTLRIFMVILTMILLLGATKVQAALQSNPTTHYNKSYQKRTTDWMKPIRQMEAENGAMGLSEKFEGDLSPKKDSNGKPISNNIDVHMMRNTEYGAIAILSTSGYGNPNTMQASKPEKSTTGNKTGVYYTTDGKEDESHKEGVAGGLSGTAFPGVNARYWDAYSSETVKKGDAMNLQWQGTSTKRWVDSSRRPFIRNCCGYFGFYSADYNDQVFSRGVAVCGVGF